jgi:uncharacterized membrane protein YhaH (DUF805 family)
MDLISILFSFQGRINRAKYWLVALTSLKTFCLRGTRGPNRFGPDPLGAASSSNHTASPTLAGA